MTSRRGARAMRAVTTLALILPLTLSLPADGRKKVTKCKRGQIVVKVQGKRTCRAFGKAFPKPRAGDPRLSFARTALGLRVKGQKRTPAAARKGIARIRRALPSVLAKLDAQAHPARAAVAMPRAACPEGSIPELTSTSTVGGASVSITTGNDMLSANLSADINGYRVIVRFSLGSPCDGFHGPPCPTAQGILEATDTNGFAVSTKVLHGADVVSDTTVKLRGTVKLTAQVADDAKLDTLELADKVRYAFSVKGISAEATIRRHALINMRNELWLPEGAAVNVSFLMHGGADLGAAARSDLAAQLAADYDKTFPEIVSKELKTIRSLETAWQQPGTCAELAFDPASNTLQPLATGYAGQLTGRVVAKSDGATAKSGRWTLAGAQNGTITPSTATGAMPAFTFVVTNMGNGIKLMGDFKATSTAGVASGSWEQPTKSGDRVVRIVGTFTGSQDYAQSDGHWVWSWSGNATFGPPNTNNPGANGLYPIVSGSASYEATFTANGPGQFGGCSAHGSETVNLTGPGWDGSWQVIGTGNDGLSPPYEYRGVIEGFSDETANMIVTRSSCPNPSDNGTPASTARPQPVATCSDSENSYPMSADGLSYTGTCGPFTLAIPDIWHWDFHGETE
jgi:hypothetical protein